MSGDHHGNTLRNTRTNHVANCGPSEIVKEPLPDLGFLAGIAPRSSELLDSCAFAVKDVRAAQLALHELRLEYLSELFIKVEDASLIVFRCARFQPKLKWTPSVGQGEAVLK